MRPSGKQRPARAVPSRPAVPSHASRAQRLRDPGILCLLPFPLNRAPGAPAKAVLAGTLGCCRRGAPAVEVSAPSPQGAPVAFGQRRSRGTRKWGTKTLAGRVTGARRCRAPARARRAPGGAASSCAGRAGQRCGPPTPPRLSVPEPLAASAALCVAARIQGLCGGFDCISKHGRSLLPAPAFRRFQLRPSPQVSGCLCRWRRWLGQAALGGWRDLPEPREECHRCSLGHFAQGGQPGPKG